MVHGKEWGKSTEEGRLGFMGQEKMGIESISGNVCKEKKNEDS